MKRIIGIGLLFLGTLISVGCGVEQEAYDSLNQLLIESVAEDGPGVVLYANGPRIGEQVFARGTVDRERDNNARTINHFRIGGITKAFMSTLVLQMVTEGNLTLEDTLAAHLPGEIADNIPNSNQITIRQMLNMTSGIAEYRDNPDFWTAVNNKTTRGWSPFDLIAYAYPLEPTFAPGEGVAYSNTNYLLLQLILGTVLEDPLAEEMRDRILDPLNMQETFFEPIGETTGAHVPGYADVNGDGNVESFAPYDDGRGLGDLGLISAALDLGKFAPALYNRTLPGENGRSESLATNPLPNGDEYGLGIMKREAEWGALWGYNGRTTGFVTQMWYLPAYDLTVIVLINHETPELADKLVQDALSAAIVIEGE